MPSPRFEELEKRIWELRQSFLPATFEPTGSYADIIFEHTRAFRVLSHAEFESFIEDRTVEVIGRALADWKTRGTISTALLAAVAHRESSYSIPGSLGDAADKPSKYPTLEARVDAAVTEINRYARTQNHGIKEKNLLRLLLPIGFTEADIDAAWLSATEAWATVRGDSAHKAAKMHVQPDPQNELKTVTLILEGFREIDMQMNMK